MFYIKLLLILVLLLCMGCEKKATIRFQLADKVGNAFSHVSRDDLLWFPIAEHDGEVCVPITYYMTGGGGHYYINGMTPEKPTYAGNPYIIEPTKGWKYGVVIWKKESPELKRLRWFSEGDFVVGKYQLITLPVFEDLAEWKEEKIPLCDD